MKKKLFALCCCLIFTFLILPSQTFALDYLCKCADQGNSNEYSCERTESPIDSYYDPNPVITTKCTQSNYVCYNDDNTETPTSGALQGMTIAGVRCALKCSCNDTNKSNEYTCNGQTITCAKSGDVCVTNKNYLQKMTDGALKNEVVAGIQCLAPLKAKAPLPPPPSPPCERFNADGQCLSILTVDPIKSIKTEPEAFITNVFSILIALSGGIALFLLMRAGYKIQTSQGKPEALQEGREQLIAAILGLLFIIFSFVILETIGVDILKIPDVTNSNQQGGGSGNIPEGGGSGELQQGGSGFGDF